MLVNNGIDLALTNASHSSDIHRAANYSDDAAFAAFKRLAQNYLMGYTGSDNYSSNRVLHRDLRVLIASQGSISGNVEIAAQMERLTPLLQYRVSLRSHATECLRAADMPLPYNLICEEWDDGESRYESYDAMNIPALVEHDFREMVVDAGTLPPYTYRQGSGFRKAMAMYVVATLCIAGYNKATMHTRCKRWPSLQRGCRMNTSRDL